MPTSHDQEVGIVMSYIYMAQRSVEVRNRTDFNDHREIMKGGSFIMTPPRRAREKQEQRGKKEGVFL